MKTQHLTNIFPYLLCLTLLFTAGCDLFKPQKREIERHHKNLCASIDNDNWEKVEKFFAEKFEWEEFNGTIHKDRKGKADWIASIRDVKDRRKVFIEDVTLKELSDGKTILARVTMRVQVSAGIIEVSNYVWHATLRWEKENDKWRLAGIKDLDGQTKYDWK